MKKSAVFLIIAVLIVWGLPADLVADSGTILSIRRASTDIKALAAIPPSVKLNSVEQEYYKEFEELLNTLSRKLDEIAARAGKAPLRDYSASIQEAYRSFDLEYLILQKKISQDNRQFTMISNIMKTKHDTARSAINNIR